MRPIPQSLLDKIKKQNQTIYEGAEPKMSIQVSRAKTTVMDSTYWTVETIRTKEGLGDLSIAARRYKPYGGPNKLFNAFIDNGIVKVATRDYPDYQKKKWQTQFELGQGSAVAIAFDGHWELYRKKWQLVTVEDPFLFWTDTNNKLWFQVWDDEDSKYQLAENVSKVKALRGWKNVNFAYMDLGVICAYIKTDGKLYYRNYCVQQDGQVVWENEREVTEFTGTAVNLNLFITNDYRTGIVVENSSGKITWLITERNWAGMAIAPERFFIRADAKVDFLPIKYKKGFADEKFVISASASLAMLWGATYNEFDILENIGDGEVEENFGIFIRLVFKHPLYSYDKSDFTIKFYDNNNNLLSFDALSIDKVSGYEYILEFVDFNIANGDITLYYNALVGTNEAGYLYDDFDIDFTPTGLTPPDMGVPEVEAIWNE